MNPTTRTYQPATPNPAHPGASDDVLYRWAQDLLDHRDPQAATRVLEDLLARTRESDPASVPAVRAELMRAYYDTARLGPAETLAREAVEADPGDAESGVFLARVLQRRSRHDDAAALLPRLQAQLGPDHEGVRLIKERAR